MAQIYFATWRNWLYKPSCILKRRYFFAHRHSCIFFLWFLKTKRLPRASIRATFLLLSISSRVAHETIFLRKRKRIHFFPCRQKDPPSITRRSHVSYGEMEIVLKIVPRTRDALMKLNYWTNNVRVWESVTRKNHHPSIILFIQILLCSACWLRYLIFFSCRTVEWPKVYKILADVQFSVSATALKTRPSRRADNANVIVEEDTKTQHVIYT